MWEHIIADFFIPTRSMIVRPVTPAAWSGIVITYVPKGANNRSQILCLSPNLSDFFCALFNFKCKYDLLTPYSINDHSLWFYIRVIKINNCSGRSMEV